MSDGSQRYDNARRIGATDYAINLPGGSPQEADRLAALAETVFATRYGLEAQIQHEYKPCDIVVGETHLDVKWTPLDTGHLILQDPKRLGRDRRHVCTAYVLVVGGEGHMRIAGWQLGRAIVAKPYAAWLSHPAWSEKQADLHQDTDAFMSRLGYPPVVLPKLSGHSGRTNGCYTCGRPPIGTFNDGSPRYSLETCSHDQH